MDRDALRPSWRKPFGMLLILLLIGGLAACVSAMATRIATLPAIAQLLLYVALGLVWITPLKPLLAWMEGAQRGR